MYKNTIIQLGQIGEEDYLMADTKRILADVDSDFFWEVKGKVAQLQIKQKSLIPLAVRELIGSDYPLDKLIQDEEDLAKIRALGYK